MYFGEGFSSVAQGVSALADLVLALLNLPVRLQNNYYLIYPLRVIIQYTIIIIITYVKNWSD
jgi:hypothetical protein